MGALCCYSTALNFSSSSIWKFSSRFLVSSCSTESVLEYDAVLKKGCFYFLQNNLFFLPFLLKFAYYQVLNNWFQWRIFPFDIILNILLPNFPHFTGRAFISLLSCIALSLNSLSCNTSPSYSWCSTHTVNEKALKIYFNERSHVLIRSSFTVWNICF